MNRRELAKNGILGLFAFLVGKLAKNPVEVPSTVSLQSYIFWQRLPVSSGNWYGFDLSGPEWDDGYSLSDGTEIEHG